MKKLREKCYSWQDMSQKKKVFCIVIGIILIILKIIAMYDLFKNQKDIEKINKLLWLFFIIIIPPAPILYFIITRKKKLKIEF
jgi:hypothetical protein